MNEIDLRRLDLNLLVVFDVLMDERHVTRAAARLGRTQSAVSHALARLREQVGDPLLVKVGGRMTASPLAERMIDDVRAILRSIQRVLGSSPVFDSATSTRTFRIACTTVSPLLIPRLMGRLREEAPGVRLEWSSETPQSPGAVAEGEVDVAFIASVVALPDGLERQEVTPLQWATFARKDHPALRRWGTAAWAKWPHLVVQMGNSVQSPVSELTSEGIRPRTIAARVPNFASVAPMLAHSDLLATLPAVVMEGTLESFGLRKLRPPVPLKPFPHRFVWSTRMAGDAGQKWFRLQLARCFAESADGATR